MSVKKHGHLMVVINPRAVEMRVRHWDSDIFLNFKVSSFFLAAMLCVQDRTGYNDNVPKFNVISGVLRVCGGHKENRTSV